MNCQDDKECPLKILKNNYEEYLRSDIREDLIESILSKNSRNLSDTPVGQRPTLRQGDSGPWVSELQKELKQLTFYDGPISGTFGPQTAASVRAFQQNNRLQADGVVGRNTWNALIFLYSPLTTCPGNNKMGMPLVGIVIDAGHGGPNDPGAVGNGIIEKNMNLDISLYMQERFNELNIPNAMTRTTDEAITPANRVARMRNAFGAQRGVILISNHINAGGGNGAEVIFPLRDQPTYSQMILDEIRKTGHPVRRVFQKPSTTNPNLDFFFMLRDTAPMQAVLMEYGFLDNPADAQRLKDNWKTLAEAVIIATCEFTGCPYSPPYSDDSIYVVQSGDTLWSIAQRFNTTVADLMQINNLQSQSLRVGQILKIPNAGGPPPQQTFTYTVVAGDSLWAIANRFNTSVAVIRSLNNLTSDVVFIGQRLNIPGSEQTPKPPTQETFTYTVVAGDSLWSIANRFNTTVAIIRSLNNLTNDNLFVGQRLTIPGSEQTPPPSFTYTVVAGDSLWSIANRFNTTVAEIRRINNLTNDNLFLGQKLIIPGNQSGYRMYTVVAGDSLWSIANRFNKTVAEIRTLNNLMTDALTIGQQLKIPL